MTGAPQYPPKYATLTDQQKWEWHADVYAFRHVALGVPMNEPASPCDPEMQWYSDALVRASVSRMLAKREAGNRAWEKAKTHSTMLEGRAAINAWARGRGSSDIDVYALAHGIDWLEAYLRGIDEIMAEAIAAKSMKDPRHRRQSLDDIRRALGLSATETKAPKVWTPEEMAAARRQLGIDQPAPAADSAA